MNFTDDTLYVTLRIGRSQVLPNNSERRNWMEKNLAFADEPIKQEAFRFMEHFFDWHKNLDSEMVVRPLDEQTASKVKSFTIPEKGRDLDEVVCEMEENVYPYGYNVNHPRYFGFVPGPSTTLSFLGDVMTAAYNRHASSYLTFPAGVQLEQSLISWMCQKAGYPTETASGMFVSGGSMANLTALTAARDHILSEDTFHLGVAYVSEQTHSSVEKDLRIIGIGESRIRKIPVDAAFQMDVNALETAIRTDKENGLIPFVVIASAGTTNTGSIDLFYPISDICHTYGLWMHVDGAYGGSVLLSKQHKDLLKGVELSDSISWDAHKWLFQTYSCGMVLVKDKMALVKSFHAHPEYLKDLEADNENINPWDLGLELTRPARGLKLWLTLQVMGSDAIGEAVDHGFQLAEWAQNEAEKEPAVEIISPARMAMVNFRYSPAGMTEEQKDELNQKISHELVSSGYAGVFTTELNGKKVLRICALHPDTTEADIRSTVQKLHGYFHAITHN